MIESPAIMIDFFLAGSAVVGGPFVGGRFGRFFGTFVSRRFGRFMRTLFLPCWFDFMPRRSIATWVPLEITA